jgi:hypothetical protein
MAKMTKEVCYMRIRFLFVLFVTLLFLPGCGGGGGSSTTST